MNFKLIHKFIPIHFKQENISKNKSSSGSMPIESTFFMKNLKWNTLIFKSKTDNDNWPCSYNSWVCLSLTTKKKKNRNLLYLFTVLWRIDDFTLHFVSQNCIFCNLLCLIYLQVIIILLNFAFLCFKLFCIFTNSFKHLSNIKIL